MRRIQIAISLAVVGVIAMFAAPAFAAVNWHNTSCTGAGTSTLSCSGQVTGLGNVTNATGIVVVQANFTCTTQSGSNSPPGQLKFPSGTLDASNGQVTFTNVGGTGSCPGTQTGTFSGSATISVYTGVGCAFTKKGVPNSNCTLMASTTVPIT
jgi:hypothetical protein